MEYIFDLFVDGARKGTYGRAEQAGHEYLELCDQNPLSKVTFKVTGANGFTDTGTCYADFEGFEEGLQRGIAWKPEKKEATIGSMIANKRDEDFFDAYMDKYGTIKADKKYMKLVVNGNADKEDAINPPHYKNVAAGKQYMELMVDMLPDVGSHLLGQVYKYLMRCGKKDSEVQELKKAQWYLTALIKYKEEGKVI